MKTLDHVPDAAPRSHEKSVVAFMHVETAGYTAVQTPYGYFNDLAWMRRAIRWREFTRRFESLKR